LKRTSLFPENNSSSLIRHQWIKTYRCVVTLENHLIDNPVTTN
jgi:hypothetical protein